MEKLNIAEILKDCPKGMELDCTMFEGLEFDGIIDNSPLPIRCRILNPDGNGYNIYNFTKYGCWNTLESAKCVIFPKGKTTWEGFQRPFKDGDIASTINGKWIGIVKKSIDNACETYIAIHDGGIVYYNNIFSFERFATEEEKQKLFDAIKANGYRWNAKTKTLEKLVEPKFKVGDRVKHISAYASGIVVKVVDKGYYIDYPKGEGVCFISFTLEKDYELTPNKFDITTLMPFDKVLVRDTKEYCWHATFYSHHTGTYFYSTNGLYAQCIPFEDNKHLLGTTDDCDEYYKTWE